MNINGSSFIVPVLIVDFDLYESYNDLSLSGFGVSSFSTIFLIPNVVLAG
jgi:hypothetical protein